MWKEIYHSVRMLLCLTVILGLCYPLAMTGATQILFPHQANGSILYRNGEAVGSELIGQTFGGAAYFEGRPSKAGEDGYDATASQPSNFGPTNQKLLDEIEGRAQAFRDKNLLPSGALVPSEMVTASGSGLDPHISPEGAMLQAKRIAAARNMETQKVEELIRQATEAPQIGFMGDAKVNVLKLNLALDQMTQS